MPEKRPELSLARFGGADYLRLIVDIQCGARCILIAERTQVQDRTVFPDHSMSGSVGEIAGSDNDSAVVERLRVADCASGQLWQLLHLVPMPKKSLGLAVGDKIRFPD